MVYNNYGMVNETIAPQSYNINGNSAESINDLIDTKLVEKNVQASGDTVVNIYSSADSQIEAKSGAYILDSAEDLRLRTVTRALDLIEEACVKHINESSDQLSLHWSLLILQRKINNVLNFLSTETSDHNTVTQIQKARIRLNTLSEYFDKVSPEQKADPMGFDLILKIRQLFTPKRWNSDRDTQYNSLGQADTDANSSSGHKRPCPLQNTSEASQKTEEGAPLIKYRRVDNTFPKYMPNDANDYNFVGQGYTMKGRRSLSSGSTPPPSGDVASNSNHIAYQSQTHCSLFETPPTTTTRVRNLNAPAVVDFSDEEPFNCIAYDEFKERTSRNNYSRRFASGNAVVKPPPPPPRIDYGPATSSNSMRSNMLYSDAVRHGLNGFASDINYARTSSSLSSAAVDARLNGHGTVGWYNTNTNRRSILSHTEQRNEREAYIDLINNITTEEQRKMTSRSVIKPAPPPLQRITQNGDRWPHNVNKVKSRVPPPINSLQYTKLDVEDVSQISKPAKSVKPLLPSVAYSIDNISDSFNGAKIIGISHLSSKSNSSNVEKKQAEAKNSIIEILDDDEVTAKQDNNLGIGGHAESSTQQVLPSRALVQTDALQRRFKLSCFFADDFSSTFSDRYDRKRQINYNALSLAEQEATQSTESRYSYERELRERLARIPLVSKPILVIGSSKVPEKKEVEFPPLTAELMKRYNELVSGPGHQVLISKFSLNITRNDISTLIGNRWLNDEIINFYMNMITDRSQNREGKLPSVYAMNTFFVPRLLQNGHSAVKRWTRKVDIFNKDIIPVPVHVGNVHWCMAIIHLKEKSIKYYDSMGKPNPIVLNALETYLHEESLDKLKRPFDTSDFKIESVTNVPQQMNGSDCGVFSCMFAEYITRNKALTFSQEHMDYFRKKMILEICSGELWL